MSKFIRSSSRSLSRTRTLTSSRFMNSNSSSRAFHLFNSLAVRVIAFSSFDVLFFFNSSSSFERFVSSSSLSSLFYSSRSFIARSFTARSFTARSFTARSFIDRLISSSSLNSSSSFSSSISSRSFTSESFSDVEISIFRRVNRDSFIIEKIESVLKLMKRMKFSFEDFVIKTIESSSRKRQLLMNKKK